MGRHGALAAALLFAGVLGGCAGPQEPGKDCWSAAAAGADVIVAPRLAPTLAGVPWQTVALVRGATGPAVLAVESAVPDVTANVSWVSGTLAIIEAVAQPGAPASRLTVRDGCGASVAGIDLPAPVDDVGAAGEAGKGALVATAGFWTNGTLFYTNVASLDGSDWPRAGWYAWEGAAPLPVYVYRQEPSETPPHWRGLYGNTAATPAGPFVAGPAAGADAAAGVGYFPTIRGFNEGLKGLQVGTPRVAVLAAEDAYTRAGAEDHPLYGDALVFLLAIGRVDSQPCAGEQRQVCPPSGP